MKKAYVYILSNKNRTVLYIGRTVNLLRRIRQHKSYNGAKFTKKYSAYYLLYFEIFDDLNNAIKREKQLKRWHKDWKWNLIKQNNPELKDLLNKIE